MSEEKRIMDFLGRSHIDGDVRGIHLGKVLKYLKMMKTETFSITVDKLTLILGIHSRYVRENYLKGLIAFGIIKLFQNDNTLKWMWFGEKALNKDQSLSEIIEPEKPDYETIWKEKIKQEQEKEKKKKKRRKKKNVEKTKKT